MFRYNFLPNKKYALILSALDWGEKKTSKSSTIYSADGGRGITQQSSEENRIWGLNVYTFEIGEKVPAFLMGYGKDHPNFTEFVPFLNNQGSEKVILE